jgi:Na+:H+ antiporter, NhaA family
LKVSKLYHYFLNNEKTGGLLLVICALCSFLIANSTFGEAYINFWQSNFFNQPILFWINDGLMAIFFLFISLELKREFKNGALSKKKDALLPFFGAIGGMVVPVVIYLIVTRNTDLQMGAGIPMATDIAFAVGIISLFGNRVPLALKVFLTALAVIDDLGAIICIMLFYTQSIVWLKLFLALLIFCLLLICRRTNINRISIYLLGGIGIWYCLLHSGVHASIAGVLLALALPFDPNLSAKTNVESKLKIPVTLLIIPLFAVANTAFAIHGSLCNAVSNTYTMGIALGLLIGKPLGITLFIYIAAKLKYCSIPHNITWPQIIAVGFLGGIGFTISIFITLLAFKDLVIINNAKFTILLTSLTAGTIGLLLLHATLPTKEHKK